MIFAKSIGFRPVRTGDITEHTHAMTDDATLTLPEIDRVDGMTMQDYAYRRLRNAIMLGALPAGTNLTMRGLAAHLGISATPVREAIRRLSSENAVQVLGNRRLTIPDLEAGRFDELIRLRVAIETHAARRALAYVSDILIDHLRALDLRLDDALSRRHSDDVTLLNHRFHRDLYAVNPHQRVTPLIESIWLQLGPYQRQAVSGFAEYCAIDRHKEILAALAVRDPVALALAVEHDILEGAAFFAEHVAQPVTDH